MTEPDDNESTVDAERSDEIRRAFGAWASQVFGAPAELADQITGCASRDEVIERVFTSVVRRDLVEERLPTNRKDVTRPKVDISRVDPFAQNLEQLRNQTEHVTNCVGCGGGGTTACPHCAGGGRVVCGRCSGSGQERSTRSNRMIQCSACRASRTMPCPGCGARGNVPCGGCVGHGRQLAWLSVRETTRPSVMIVPDGPTTVAYPQLKEIRAMEEADLGQFSVSILSSRNAPLEETDYRGGRPTLLDRAQSQLDSQLERVSFQQYTRFAVVRRDVSFETAGTEGIVSLLGRELRGASTREALAPIQRRKMIWAAGISVWGVFLLLLVRHNWHSHSYFAARNSLSAALGMFAFCAVGFFLWSWLGALRPGYRFFPIGAGVKRFGAAAPAALLVIVLLSVIWVPRTSAIQAAIEAGNSSDAHRLIDAAKMAGSSHDVIEFEDQLKLMDARALDEDAQLRLIDEVAEARRGHSAEAERLARTTRMARIRSLRDSSPKEAIAKIERWYPKFQGSDAEVAEERALAEEALGAGCGDDLCRYERAGRARDFSRTEARDQKVTTARTAVMASLEFSEDLAESAIARAARLRALRMRATDIQRRLATDGELTSKATKVEGFASEQRASTPILAAPSELVAELLETSGRKDLGFTQYDVDGASIFTTEVTPGTASGVYAVGSAGHRALTGKGWNAARILKQVFGHDVPLSRPANGTFVSKTKEAGVEIVSRWNERGEVVELRIGGAKP